MDLSPGETPAAPLPPPPPPPASSELPAPPAPGPLAEPPGLTAVLRPARPARVGELTPPWRVATGLVWAMVFVALVAVWKTSRELGLNTWWLGPLGDPQPWLVTLLPFLAPGAMLVLVLNGSRWLPWAGLVASAWLAGVGLADLDAVWRLALVELAIAAAGALVSVASLSGRYRRAER